MPASNAALRDRLLESPFLPISQAAAVTGQVVGNACIFGGWSVRETAGAAAVVELYSGTGTSTPFLAGISLAANGAETDPAPDEGILCEGGIFLNVVSGTVRVSVWARTPYS